MRRRDLLAGALGTGVLAGGSAIASTDGPTFEDGDGYPEPNDPVEIALIGTQREGDTMTVPSDERLTVVTFFATTCESCATKMPHLADAASEISSADVHFVSVTTQPVNNGVPESEIVDWFESRGGDWTLAHDESTDLSVTYDGLPYPKTVAIGPEGRVWWEHEGVATTDELISGITGALEDVSDFHGA